MTINWRITLVVGIFCAIGTAFGIHSTASAKSVSIAPLEYQAKLDDGENKKGFIDVMNNNAGPVTLQFGVKGFRQTDDQGHLEFYDNPSYSKGIKLDLNNIALDPGEGARVYFLLSGKDLPKGDIFAAIIASPVVNKKSKVLSIPSASVGTLLMLENGTGSDHHAAITALETNWLQTGTSIESRIIVHNTDSKDDKTLGFMPELNIGIQPYISEKVTSPLIFTGFSRVVSYQKEGSFFGPLRLRVMTGDSVQSRWIFAITGYWRWLAPLLAVVLVGVVVSLRYQLRRYSRPISRR